MSARFVLVHGAWHRGSCWEPLTAELTARGHAVVAPDMPSDESGRGAQDYADAVLAALSELPDGPGPLVLVAHSLGGLTVPLAAERLGPDRVAAIVLVAAMSAVPGTSFIGRMSEESLMVPGYDRGVRRGESGSTYWPPDAVADGLYRGVADEIGDGGAAVVATAADGLRPQTWTIGKEVTPLAAWPPVRTVSVVCAADRVADPDACRRAAAAVGADVVELGGGHFPMLTRPAELAGILGDAAGPPVSG